MKLQVEIAGHPYTVSSQPFDISIPLQFNGPQPNTYGVPRASSQAFEGGGFIGDTRRGGGCNFESYTFIPHCNGTHTECAGHILNDRISVANVLQPGLQPAVVISVNPVAPQQTSDSYDPPLNPEDRVIDANMLQQALANHPPEFYRSIVIRTLPNQKDKKSRDYMQQSPAFFTLDAMRYLVSLDLKHLLVDIPSVDRLFDESKLNNHHIFWEVPAGQHWVDPQPSLQRTITEMIFVPDYVPDGSYLLDLQIAPFVSDAAPSRPVLFSLIG